MGGAEGMAPHSKDCCQSAGVVCADSRVIELNWDGKSGAMVSLPGFKKFSKQISLGLAKLELNVLDLSHNQLTGGIPDNLQTLKSLTVLQFNGNSLAGRIPPWLGELPSLELLYLDHNKFFGTIPESLSNLANLKYLALENNFLTGPIPQSFVKLGNLIQLHLLSNNLEGEIPNMSGLASLNWVRVQKNPMLLVNDILSKFPDGIRVEYSP